MALGGAAWRNEARAWRRAMLKTPRPNTGLNTSPSCFLFPHSDKFAEVLQKQQQDRIERNRERIHMMNANPFDPDVQTKIAEEIR